MYKTDGILRMSLPKPQNAPAWKSSTMVALGDSNLKSVLCHTLAIGPSTRISGKPSLGPKHCFSDKSDGTKGFAAGKCSPNMVLPFDHALSQARGIGVAS
eukprot:GHRR01034915.1.p2 GENE.GHRR01034915.1~~GHRR01034915.1.p2  ORF type:complete len:100 (+),score=3.61 GHRR01034915.1:68-367(+)